MGTMYAEIELTNPLVNNIGSCFVRALPDSGVMHLCIPQHVAYQLNLKRLEDREVIIADGSKRRVPYVGPIQITFKNRSCFTGAMVLGDEVLLGAIPMEDMDLVIQPSLLKVTVNPQSPNIPMSVAKGES